MTSLIRSSSVPSEPEDVNPEPEAPVEPNFGCEEDPLDSSDDGEPDDVLATLASVMPAGYTVAAPPQEAQLEYKGSRGEELKGRQVIVTGKRWAGASERSPRSPPTAVARSRSAYPASLSRQTAH